MQEGIGVIEASQKALLQSEAIAGKEEFTFLPQGSLGNAAS